MRRSFRRNLADTSPRLVYPALAAGYRTLGLLRDARSSFNSRPNDAHASILRLLRDRQRERQRSLFAKAAHPPHSRNPPKPSSAPRKDALPLLVRVSPSPPPSTPGPPTLPVEQPLHDPFVYVDPTAPRPPIEYTIPHRPRPLSELGGTGRRKAPHIDMGGDFPFLRIKKPQPEYLSRILTQKGRVRVRRTEAMQMIEEALDDVTAEDDWDRIVEALLAGDEPGSGRGDLGVDGGPLEYDRNMQITREPPKDLRIVTASGRKVRIVPGTETYAGSHWRHGYMHIQALLHNEKEDQVARARAMRDLVIQERQLVAEEKAARKSERRKRWEERLRLEGREEEIKMADARVRERRAAAQAGMPRPRARAT